MKNSVQVTYTIQRREWWRPSGSQPGGWRPWSDWTRPPENTSESALGEIDKMRNWGATCEETEYRAVCRTEEILDATATGTQLVSAAALDWKAGVKEGRVPGGGA